MARQGDAKSVIGTTQAPLLRVELEPLLFLIGGLARRSLNMYVKLLGRGRKASLHVFDLFLQRAFQAWIQPEAFNEVLLQYRSITLSEA